MSKAEDEFINNPVNANCAADEFQVRVIRVVENEMIQVELAQTSTANSSCELHSFSKNSHKQAGRLTVGMWFT